MMGLTEDQQQRMDRLPDDQLIHVYPLFGGTHITDRRIACWCHPLVEFVPGGALITHNVVQ